MVGRFAAAGYKRGDGDRDCAFTSCARVAAGGVALVLSKLGRRTSCPVFRIRRCDRDLSWEPVKKEEQQPPGWPYCHLNP